MLAATRWFCGGVHGWVFGNWVRRWFFSRFCSLPNKNEVKAFMCFLKNSGIDEKLLSKKCMLEIQVGSSVGKRVGTLVGSSAYKTKTILSFFVKCTIRAGSGEKWLSSAPTL